MTSKNGLTVRHKEKQCFFEEINIILLLIVMRKIFYLWGYML